MSASKYLEALLISQALPEGCDEHKTLDNVRDQIERIVKNAYPESALYFTHGGSRAKGTIIREDYDLDLVVYFDNDDCAAGESLEAIYENIATLLAKTFKVTRKRSALRLGEVRGDDLRVDVVPGRYTDSSRTDAYIHQNEGSKERQKTNLEIHISHVRDSGHTDVIALAKLWRTRNNIGIKTFPLELLVIVVLDENGNGDLEARFRRVLDAFAERINQLHIVDPANPYGNDLTHAFTDGDRRELSEIATDTLDTVDELGWEHVFGEIEARSAAIPRAQILRSAAAAIVTPTPPWSCADDVEVV